jgi:hypothetical protein
MVITVMRYTTKVLVCFVTSIALLLSAIVSSNQTLAAKSDEVEVRGSKVILSEGDAMKATLKSDEPIAMDEVSFSAKRVGTLDPFASSRIPFTVEVYENNSLVASESFTHVLEDKFEKVSVMINNVPKMDVKYKMLIRYDIPENNGQDKPIQIDTDTIEINGGEDGIEVHGRLKVILD